MDVIIILPDAEMMEEARLLGNCEHKYITVRVRIQQTKYQVHKIIKLSKLT